MKHLLLLAFLALALALPASAQTTNIIFAITVEEPTRTNIMTVTASSKEVRGLSLNWAKDIMLAEQATNSPPTFRKSVQDWQKAALVPLQAQADADERKRDKITALLEVIATNYDALNNTQKQQLKDIANTVVAP